MRHLILVLEMQILVAKLEKVYVPGTWTCLCHIYKLPPTSCNLPSSQMPQNERIEYEL